MVDIVKGVIDGGWALLVGWILPAALTLLLFGIVLYPTVEDIPPWNVVAPNAITVAATAVAIGIVLSALKTPLYRVLEGYVWPTRLFERGKRRHVKRRLGLLHALNYAGHQEAKRNDNQAEVAKWASAAANAEAWFSEPDNFLKSRQRARRRAAELPKLRRLHLAERLERYPVDDDQILPTALGNAIRRFERFGPVHYGLDQQLLWYELIGTAPDSVGKQVAQMRTAVDFFVALFYGQAVLAAGALVAFPLDPSRRWWLGVGALVAATAATISYRGAVSTTDEWAYAVQALLNIGRKPLAEALHLELPATLAEEQHMWRSMSRFLRQSPRPEAIADLDLHRLNGAPD